MRTFLLFVAVVGFCWLISTCCGCSSQSGKLVEPQVQPAALLADQPLPAAAGLPPLPRGRAISAVQDYTLDGCETYDRSANAADDGTALKLNAGPAELAWGIWGWDAADKELISLAYEVEVPAGAAMYFALADYVSQRWELYGPLTTGAEIALDGARHKSPLQSVYCALLAYDDCAPSALTLTLKVNTGANDAPLAMLETDPDSGQAPLTVGCDASGSLDADGYIADFEWDLDGNGSFSEPGREANARGMSNASVRFEAAGDYLIQLRVTDDGGLTDTASTTVAVAAPNQPPVADLQADPLSGNTPLTVNLDASGSSDPDGGPLACQWDLDGDAVFGEPGAEAAAEDMLLTAAVYSAAGDYTVSVRVRDAAGAEDIAAVLIAVAGNLAPSASLLADRTAGEPPLTVNFDASGSSDADGSIADYEWDLDGDALFSEAGAEADAHGAPTAQYSYAEPGAWEVRLRVTDDSGGTAEAGLTIRALGWVIVTVQFKEKMTGTSLKLVDGRPAISYCDSPEGDLIYAFSRSSYGTSASDWEIVTVDDAAASSCSSLAIIDGQPAIAYERGWDRSLGYARSLSADGQHSTDWQCLSLDGTGDMGCSPSLAEISGRPGIAYHSGTLVCSYLKYACSSTATGANAADWHYVTVDTGRGLFFDSLAQVDGKPAIAYYEEYDNALQYAYADTASGAAADDWHSLLLDSFEVWAGEWCSLTVVDGVPAIAYAGLGGNHLLRYAVSANAQGHAIGDWSMLTVDAGPACGVYSSIADIGGKPAIAYYDMAEGVQHLAVSATARGLAVDDWSCSVVDDSLYCGEDCSLALIHGCPAISYYHSEIPTGELRYAIWLQ